LNNIAKSIAAFVIFAMCVLHNLSSLTWSVQ